MENEEKYFAVTLLHALGDTIGFKNGDWEFNYYDTQKLRVLDYVNELIYEFIALGGVNGIDLKDWKISDDTFFHIAMMKSMLDFRHDVNDRFISKVKNHLRDEATTIWNEMKGEIINEEKATKIEKINRYIGIATSNSIKRFTEMHDARNEKYDNNAGGNGAAMRTLVIGMCFFGEDNREKLIDASILTSQLTHNNAYGYLAGFNAAFFTALAFEGIEMSEWPYMLIEQLRSDKLKSFLSLNNLETQVYDHNMYIRYWQKYIDTRFDSDRKPIRIKAFSNPMHRIRYFHENFFKDTPSYQIGASGYLCMIMAYDALIESDGKWEKLIVYSILHSGDSDTIGAVAAGLYGATYGFGDVPPYMLKHIERKKEIEQLTTDIIKKFVIK